MSTDPVSSRLPVELLTKSNWRQVFTDLQLWLESRGLFYVCENIRDDYCSWRNFQGQIHSKKDEKKKEVEGITAGIEDLEVDRKGSLNIEKASKWDKDASAVIYWLRQCCPYDTDIIEEQGNPRDSWKALYKKYSKVKPGDLRQLEREITSFDRGSQAPGKSPEDCFSLLKVLRRRFLMQKPEKRESFTDENLFGYLLDGLVENEWKLTKDTLDAQPFLSCDDKLDILQRLWENTPFLQGPLDEGAFVANNRWPKSRASSSRQDRSPRNRARGSRCFQCLSEEHRIDVCPYKETAKEIAKEWAVQQRLNDEKLRRTYCSKPSASQQKSSKRPFSKERNVRFETPQSKNEARAYSAHDIDSEEYEDDALDTEHEDGDLLEEGMMALGGKKIVLSASHCNGVYSVDSVMPATASEFAFNANQN
ncbi:hypothetical protein EPUL_005981, partial [Erysiphe pulchra]